MLTLNLVRAYGIVIAMIRFGILPTGMRASFLRDAKSMPEAELAPALAQTLGVRTED